MLNKLWFWITVIVISISCAAYAMFIEYKRYPPDNPCPVTTERLKTIIIEADTILCVYEKPLFKGKRKYSKEMWE